MSNENRRNKKTVKNKNKKSSGTLNISRKGKITIGIICSVILLVVLVASNLTTVLGMFGINSDLSGQLNENKKYSMFTVKENLYSDIDSTAFFGMNNSINILVFGLDRTEERDEEYSIYRPDTIMLISIPTDGKEITIVSIPRDTYVSIAGYGTKDKINACFAYGAGGKSTPEARFEGGLEVFKNTVSNILGGIPINYYVGVDMDGAAGIVDAIGGVDYYVEKDIYNSNGALLFRQGWNHLDGVNFVQLARMRNYADGDIQRVRIQQDLIRFMFMGMKELPVTKIPSLVSKVYSILQTDITIKDAYALGTTILNNLSFDKIFTGTMPGMHGNLKGLAYWIVDQSERVSFIKQYYGVTVSRLEQDPTFIPPDNIYGLTWVLNSSGHPVMDDTGYPILYDKFGFRVQTDENGNPVLDKSNHLIRIGKYIDLGIEECCDCGCLEGDDIYYCKCIATCECTECHPELYNPCAHWPGCTVVCIDETNCKHNCSTTNGACGGVDPNAGTGTGDGSGTGGGTGGGTP